MCGTHEQEKDQDKGRDIASKLKEIGLNADQISKVLDLSLE